VYSKRFKGQQLNISDTFVIHRKKYTKYNFQPEILAKAKILYQFIDWNIIEEYYRPHNARAKTALICYKTINLTVIVAKRSKDSHLTS